MDAGTADELDSQVRNAAFRFLEEHTRLHGEDLPRAILEHGFEFQGERVRLVGPQGIFKPKILQRYPLSILTVAPRPGGARPYDDGFETNEMVRYRYRGTDPNFHENVRLREAMEARIPLIYFHGSAKGIYIASWPVYIVDDSPANLAFLVDVDSGLAPSQGAQSVAGLTRRYGMRTTRQRLHQRTFRARVLRAYREHCAMCGLGHEQLLDAAHIIPDSEEGEPRVSNGLSLCKLHHAAFDQQFIGIRPDFLIEVRTDIRNEKDGPMLLHGLQGLHQEKILVPSRDIWKPDKAALEQRYTAFRGQ